MCVGLLDLKNEREQKIFEGAPGSRDLESLEKKQHLEQRRKRANKRVREESAPKLPKIDRAIEGMKARSRKNRRIENEDLRVVFLRISD